MIRYEAGEKWVIYTSEEGMKQINKALERERRNLFFLNIWKTKPHKSEISGDFLSYPALSIYFHHILPKKQYPQAEFDEENIILLTPEEHDNVEINIYRYEEINKRREQLKIKYNL